MPPPPFLPTLKNPQAPLKKSHPPFLLTLPPKNSKIASSPLFLGSPVERGEGHCGYSLFGKIEDGNKIEIRIISVIIVIMIVITSYFT